jgi:uncharacterized protein YaaQ
MDVDLEEINLLVVVFVMGTQSGQLVSEMREKDYRFTEVDSSGGFLQEPITCFFVGMNNQRLQPFLELVRSVCHMRMQYIPARLDVAAILGQPVMIEAEMGGAVIFALEVERFVQSG